MQWPNEWPLLELCFKLMSWFPMLRDDPEGQVYLEAVSRAIAQAATFSPYRSTILRGQPPHGDNSVKAAIRDFLALSPSPAWMSMRKSCPTCCAAVFRL